MKTLKYLLITTCIIICTACASGSQKPVVGPAATLYISDPDSYGVYATLGFTDCGISFINDCDRSKGYVKGSNKQSSGWKMSAPTPGRAVLLNADWMASKREVCHFEAIFKPKPDNTYLLVVSLIKQTEFWSAAQCKAEFLNTTDPENVVPVELFPCKLYAFCK
ncbi:hypothetical protein [Herbaspirillum rhizosphaerae]|uniref:hypothetical protein n=1 Tax=Herbaspirillum rhizosphaerae TaxID=346179 RepID=UPI00067AC803|nr:hypothetical protein [Herbaspirillum rhizosphaerae]